MDKDALIGKMIETEWEMFHNVNGETRADCQENPAEFWKMRGAQYKVWDEAVCESYYQDLLEAKEAGRNLPREKYIHMMSVTAPAEYVVFAHELPEITERKKELAEGIWAITGRQTDEMREEYPLLALGGRPLHQEEAFPGQTSVEVYQKGELLTYSEKTLELLLDQVKKMQKEGKSYAYEVQLETVRSHGYASLKEAEESLLSAAKKRFSEAQVEEILKAHTGCPNCVRK